MSVELLAKITNFSKTTQLGISSVDMKVCGTVDIKAVKNQTEKNKTFIEIIFCNDSAVVDLSELLEAIKVLKGTAEVK